MTKFVGRRGILGGAKEASRGVGVSPTLWVPRVSMSFDDRAEQVREEEGLGRIEDSDSNYVLRTMGEGEVEMNLEDKIVGLFLTSLFGASPTTTGGPTYTHAYSLSQTNQHQSLSLYYKDPDVSRLFPLSVVDTFEISQEADGIGMLTVGFKSKAGRDWTDQTAVFTSKGNKFTQQHLAVKLAAATGDLAAATAISVKSLTLSFSANTDYDNVLGTAEPEDILNHQFSVEGSINLNKEDSTYRNYMLAGTYRAMEIKWNRASNSSLTFQFPRVDFSEWEQDRSLDDIVTQSINFKANYDATNAVASVSTASLVNTYAGTAY